MYIYIILYLYIYIYTYISCSTLSWISRFEATYRDFKQATTFLWTFHFHLASGQSAPQPAEQRMNMGWTWDEHGIEMDQHGEWKWINMESTWIQLINNINNDLLMFRGTNLGSPFPNVPNMSNVMCAADSVPLTAIIAERCLPSKEKGSLCYTSWNVQCFPFFRVCYLICTNTKWSVFKSLRHHGFTGCSKP